MGRTRHQGIKIWNYRALDVGLYSAVYVVKGL